MNKTTDLKRLLPENFLPKSELLQRVASYAAQSLSNRAQKYLDSRGISTQSIRDWQLGYFPRNMLPLFERVNPVELRAHGIVYSAHNGPLQRRITFPIYNQQNQVVAIAGRPPISEEERKQIGFEPKYWHNAFKKGKCLYGLYRAKEHIFTQQKAIVAEGQFDVIMGHQLGFRNIVCPCGTALTDHHLLLLARYTQEVDIVFDGDSAGSKNAKKVNEHKHKGLKINIIQLPEGYDLDLYLRTFGAESFRQLISSTDFADSIMSRLKN